MFNAAPAVTAVVESALIPRSAEMVIYVIVALFVTRLEIQRRLGDNRLLGSGYVQGCKRILSHCAPEMAAVAACLMLAALLRAMGSGEASIEQAVWDEISSKWPLLVTADSLLSLQSMLRCIVLLSTVLRFGRVRPQQPQADRSFLAAAESPLADEFAALSFCSQIARCAVLCLGTSYMLDGPIGGALPAACDIFSIPLLVALGGVRTLRRCPFALGAVTFAVAWLASRHCFCLADDKRADQAFVAAHLLESLAAFAYLARSILTDTTHWTAGSPAIGFAHFAMIAQQGLSTYYFFTAFEEVPGVIREGRPFFVLQILNFLQFGAFVATGVLFVVEQSNHGNIHASAVIAASSAAVEQVVHQTQSLPARAQPQPAAAKLDVVASVTERPAVLEL